MVDTRAEILQTAIDSSVMPLSFQQERLWFLEQLQTNGRSFTQSVRLVRRGELDRATLSARMEACLEKYPVLRTRFAVKNDTLTAQALPLTAEAVLRFASGGAAEIARFVGAPFNLTQDALLRAAVFSEGDMHTLVLVAHQSLLSRVALWQVVGALLGAENTPTADFSAYATAQRAANTQASLAYWRQLLQEPPSATEFPIDKTRPTQQTLTMHSRTFALSAAQSARVQAFAAAQETDAARLLFAAFVALLYRYTHSEDLLLGYQTAEPDLIGQTENVLPLRFRMPTEALPTFAELVSQVTISQSSAQSRAVPFALLLDDLKPDRDLSRAPLVQVSYAYDGTLPNALGGWQADAAGVQVQTEMFDVSLRMWESDGALCGQWEYAADLFDDSTFARIGQHFINLLENGIAQPATRISHLEILTPDELHNIMVAWNNNPKTYDKVVPVYRLFEEWVEQQPDALAAIDAHGQLTYDALNRRANRLAHFLVEAGVGSDKVVALLGTRSNDYLTAILAIHKAGGAFLPLDPKHPAARVADVLMHSESVMILIDEDFREVANEAVGLMAEGAPRPAIARIDESIAAHSDETNIPQRCKMTDLAYVMFTSGSTGKPKGVMVEHLGMLNHNHAKTSDLEMTRGDVLAQNGPQTFDIMAWQFVAALMIGGVVHIVKDEIAQNPAALLHFVEEQQITVLQMVPVVLEGMVQEAQRLGDARPKLSKLKWVVPTGDALPTQLCREWLALYPQIPLMNTYGSTECSDDQCHYPVRQVPPDYRLPIMTVGRPIFNMQIYVLDKWLKPVPIGVTGELYVGGMGVGRGYLKDPERTALAFQKDPFKPNDPSAKLYKMGDQGRYLPDGTIEFLGRVDFMVKVRGFRIELGEIEAALSKHPAMKQRIVKVHEDKHGTKHLVAYVVFHEGQAPDNDALRAHLRTLIPEYMIPSFFVTLDALPVNSNGKVDRKQLPAPDIDAARAEAYVAPSTPTEKRLAEMWQAALNVERVGVQDNFFELGGHSLMAIKIFAQIQREYGKELPLATLFRAPTIEQLAPLLATQDQATLDDLRSAAVPIRTQGAQPPFFCVGGGVINMNNLANQLGDDQPFYALQWQSLTNEEIMHSTVEQAAQSFIKAIKQVQPQGPYYIGGSFASGVIAVEVARQLEAMGETVALLAGFDAIVWGATATSTQNKPKRSKVQKLLGYVQEGKLGTLWERVRDYDYEEAFQHFAWKLGYKFYSATGQPIPAWMYRGIFEEFCILRATNAHKPSGKFSGGMTLFLTPDRHNTFQKFAKYGWDEYVAGDVEVHITPGDPCTIMLDPYVDKLGDVLKADMAAIRVKPLIKR